MTNSEEEQYRVLSFLDFGSFPGSICFSSGYSIDDLLETLKKKRLTHWHWCANRHKGEFAPWFTLRTTVDDDGEEFTYYFIFIRDPFDFSDLSMCYLAHEVLHLCQFHLQLLLNRNREHEAEAYTHTHVMKQCLAALRCKPGKTVKPRLKEESTRFKTA